MDSRVGVVVVLNPLSYTNFGFTPYGREKEERGRKEEDENVKEEEVKKKKKRLVKTAKSGRTK